MKIRAHVSILLFFSLLFLFAASVVIAGDCGGSDDAADRFQEPTFTVRLPVDDRVTDGSMLEDSITVPSGRPIYAIFVHGFTQNHNFDQLMCYNFAKRLMEDGAYVHYAWWNNLCAEYMARPLHRADSHPGDQGFIGYIEAAGLDWLSKAVPVEDYQFQSDAEAFLQAIRKNNPSAIIILAGHSMGGAAVARLATNTKVVIDILAPLDPVENRSNPVVRYGLLYNWTRYRIGHLELEGPPPYADLVQRKFGTNVINLFHRYQNEGLPPSDYEYVVPFGHDVPPGGTSTQRSVATCAWWEINCFTTDYCCSGDGHGEVVGFRGLAITSFGIESVPVALQARNGWPKTTSPGDICRRRRLLMEMPYADYNNEWIHRPAKPEYCMVSDGLISLYENMNRPPVADAGGDRNVLHTASGVTLDGSASTDPDNDDLEYTWAGAQWEMYGRVVTVPLGIGRHKITLTVKDPTGHIDCDTIELTVVDQLDDEPKAVTRMVGAYPNPFNAATHVAFELSERQMVSVQIFDLRGRLVRTLEEGTLGEGRHERFWDGHNDAGRTVASGAYFARMRAGDRTEFSKILLLK